MSLIVAPDRSQVTMIGIQLSIPIFSGGGIQSQLREARATSKQAEYEVLATRSDAAVKVRKAFQDVTAGVQRIAALEQAAIAAKASLDANTLALKVGVKDTQDVLNAQQNYYQTLEQLSHARYQYLMSKLSLDLLTGRLDETSIARINRRLHSRQEGCEPLAD
ncbi:MAG: TolC family protein [Gammaproteobacteria bacterium]|nr:TolC family protein [Gammaproteobacteria bacterium]